MHIPTELYLNTYQFFLDDTVWWALFHFRVFFRANILNGQQNGVTWKDMIYISNFILWDTVTKTWSRNFFEQPSDRHLVIFLKVSIMYPIIIRMFSWTFDTQPSSLLSTDKSKCAAKLRFTSVFANTKGFEPWDCRAEFLKKCNKKCSGQTLWFSQCTINFLTLGSKARYIRIILTWFLFKGGFFSSRCVVIFEKNDLVLFFWN